MRNLVQYVHSTLSTGSASPLPLQRFAFSEDVVAVCFASDDVAAVHLWSPQNEWFEETSWPLPEPGLKCIGLNYDSLECKVMAVFSNGDFVECKDGEATVAGSLESSVIACEWSPTGELACIVLGDHQVLLLSTDFEAAEADVVIGKHQMSVEDFDLADKHVSVGWGKRETQFQGRGFKKEQKMRDPTTVTAIESRDPFPNTEDDVSVSWRGDGQYVVVNSCLEGQRALRIFNSMGQLESVSEPASNLLGHVAWEPKGGLLATVRPNEVQFFERNGLKRYAFDITGAESVKQLAWSADSSVLAIVHSTYIDLYTMKNWHWYRKQSMQCNGQHVVWHPEMPCTMGVIESENIQFYTWRLSPATDSGLAAVIDNNMVRVTPLDRCGMPPPMALVEQQLNAQPVAVAVKFPNTVAVSTTANKVHVFELQGSELHQVDEIASPGKLLSYNDAGDLIIYTGYSLRFNGTELAAEQASLLKGEFYLRGPQLCTLNSTIVHNFGEPCVDFVVYGDESYALTRSQKLVHSSGVVIAHGVTSMLASGNEHILYTTMNTLRFLHLGQLQTDAASNNTTNSEQVREIERGSLLVTAMPHKMAVVLQAPRGNLETIYPRIFVLGEVRKQVAEHNYTEAFRVCRAHRIDMNLLYDLSPTQFSAELSSIVKQLSGEIDLFLTSLQNTDVTKSLYFDTTKDKSIGSEDATVEGKVNHVLDMLRPLLAPKNEITSWCLRQPPAYVEALTCASKSPELIKHLLVLCDADTLYRTALSVYEPKLALVVAQQAQMDPKEYIPFLRARNEENEFRCKFQIDLYLRKYESAVVHLISDPDATGDEISDFTIRHELHSIALTKLREQQPGNPEAEKEILLSQAELWLAASRHVDAGINFELLGEKKRALDAYVLGCSWRKALSICDPSSVKEVAERLVETTEADKRYGDCATIYLQYLSEPQRALEFYCQGNHFDEAVLVARQHKLDSKLHDLLRESFGSFQELLADFSEQIPAQLKRLRQIRTKRKEDMLGFEQQQSLESHMDGLAIDDNLSVTGSEATTTASVYTRYTDKTGASTGTAATNATRRTLKNQRRQDRKKARGKKGSVYEEDYLIASTSRLVARLQDSRSDLRELVVALTRCGLVVYANRIESEYTKVVNLLANNVDEIYVLDEEARVRFDSVGQEYLAEQPVKPTLPPVDLY